MGHIMTNKFINELPKKITGALPGPDQLEFSLYVCLTREKLGWDRGKLAEESGLEREFLTFLENQLLQPDELTEKVRRKLESVLGISFLSFKWSNQSILDELRDDWDRTSRLERPIYNANSMFLAEFERVR